MKTVAFVDTSGLCYDGNTLKRRGLGGSESAVISMSRELAKLGFTVIVFNDCTSDDCCPGYYDGVLYEPIKNIENYEKFDVYIASRSVVSFMPDKDKHQFKWASQLPNLERVSMASDYRILWMHDTFCDGDLYIEDLVKSGRIHTIFTLSDWHTTYVTNCNHGKRRHFETLKNHIFQTRNGINIYNNDVDISAKDPDLFVYNASVTKGMVPLVEHIWPEFKKQNPKAKLTIIGGFYRFRDSHGPDAQELTHRELVKKCENLDITFTGIITQKEIADIMAKASFMMYPSAFPETFGISTLESLAYNTPLITCRMGALEETAIDIACYKITQAIEPNVLFEDIDFKDQCNKFLGIANLAYRTPYLHQQKMYACNQVKDVCTWDTVALQWKQQIYYYFKMYLPVVEYRKVIDINQRVKEVFGRTFTNQVEKTNLPKTLLEKHLSIVVPVYNSELYIRKCLESIFAQDYRNYSLHIVDDASTDNTHNELIRAIEDFCPDKEISIHITKNKQNKGAVYNQVKTIKGKNVKESDIVILIDGDDWLPNNPNIFYKINRLYHEGAEFTYGSCRSEADNIPLIAQHYPEEVKKKRAYRNHKFNWGMPYTHLRTFLAKSIKNANVSCFKDSKGHWYKAGGDNSVFYTALEAADPKNVICVPDIMYCYNDQNPLNDYKINSTEQNKTANEITMTSKNKKRILLAIPTNKYIEVETFKSIYDLDVPSGYEIDFQYFYGYQIDQIRNLIADWGKRYDYLFSVDSDIILPKDCLSKLINADKDIITGLYIQRKPNQHVVEVYMDTPEGGTTNIPYEYLKDTGIVEVAGCGFGCVLVKSNVLRTMEYPHFYYKSALDHKNTVSEDTYFCAKARRMGYTVWADTSILCGHRGGYTFEV